MLKLFVVFFCVCVNQIEKLYIPNQCTKAIFQMCFVEVANG